MIGIFILPVNINTNNNINKISLLFALIIILIASYAFAHEEEEFEKPAYTTASITDNAIFVITSAAVISAIFVFIAVFKKKKTNSLKLILFLGIIIPIIIATFYSAISTLYINLNSVTKGPIHWHADFEISICGEILNMKDPTGISNRVGSPLLHEHNDNRIHVEGVVTESRDISLHHLFEYVGGRLEKNTLEVPINGGIIKKSSGEICPNGRTGKIQVFVYKIKEKKYRQEKLEDYENYVLSPEINVPPGDCIIIEFGEEKSATDNICASYRYAVEKGELSGS